MADPSVRSQSPDPTLVSTGAMGPSTQNLASNQQPPSTPAAVVNGRELPTDHPQDEQDSSSVSSERRNPDTSVAQPQQEAAEPTQAPVNPKVAITLLLVSGRRRTVDFEARVTIGELKEIVWSTWPTDWSDELPPSASFLRILYLGRILTDETVLSSLNLAEPPDATVMHVSVRSFAPNSGDDVKKPKKRGSRRGRSSSGTNAPEPTGGRGDADEEERTTGCCSRCIIC